MADKTDLTVKKLLRVVVAGGIALAGVAGTRADDKAAAADKKPDQTSKSETNPQAERAGTGDAAAKDAKDAGDRKKQEEQQQKKSDEQKKSAESDGGGVQGW